MNYSIDWNQFKTAKAVKNITMVFLGGPVCVVGIVTSALSIILFRRDTSTTASTRLLLSAIAVADVFFLIFMFLFWTVKRSLPEDSDAFRFFEKPVVFGFLFYMSNVFELYRNWLVVIVAVERLLFFIRPIEFKVIWSTRRVASIIFLLGLTSVLIRIPGFVYGVSKQLNGSPNPLTRHTRLAHSLIDCIVLTIAPVSIMISLSVATTIQFNATMKTKLRLVNTQNNTNATCQKTEDANAASTRKHGRIVKILHTVLVTFIICAIPSVFASVMHFYIVFNKIDRGRVNMVSEVLMVVSNFGSLVNSTSNFFVYVAQSKRYRYILANMLMLDRCFKSLNREPSSTIETCLNNTNTNNNPNTNDDVKL